VLNRFRDSLRGVVAWVIGILIILAMAVVGVPALDNFGGSAALSVGDKDYSARDVELELRNQLQIAQIQNPGMTRDQALASGLPQQTIRTLILRGLLEEEADRLGLAAPDDVVRSYLENLEALQNPDTGRFDQTRLSQFLSQQGLSLGAFSEVIAAEVRRSQIAEALAAGTPAPQGLTRLLLLREVEARDVSVGTVPLSDLPEPTEAELQSYLAANIDRYQSPEYRTFTVLTIEAEDVAENIDIPEEDIQQLYEVRRGEGEAAETRTFRQLRLASDEARQQAETLIAEGAGFEEVADALGAEVTTLPAQTRPEIIIEDFAEAVFEAEEGALVGPVTTPFGALLAEVLEVNAAETASLEDMRPELEAELLNEIAEDRLVELVESVEIARDEGAALAEAAQTIGLEARTTQPADRELFTRSGSIANVPTALAAEGQRLEEGEESAAIRLENGYGFIAVEEIYPSAPLPLDEVREDIVRAVMAEQREDAGQRLLAELQGKLATGTGFEAAVAELGGEAREVSFGQRTPPEDLPQAVAGRAFALNVGEVAAVTAGSGGEQAVYLVRPEAVRFDNPQQLEAVVPMIANQYTQQLGGELNESYLEALEEITKITQNERQLARALGQDTE
jgi:peptidyl-prolyl cis-trans isomerase D